MTGTELLTDLIEAAELQGLAVVQGETDSGAVVLHISEPEDSPTAIVIQLVQSHEDLAAFADNHDGVFLFDTDSEQEVEFYSAADLLEIAGQMGDLFTAFAVCEQHQYVVGANVPQRILEGL